MHEQLFSKINKLRPTPAGLVVDNVPDTARIGLANLLHRYFNPGVVEPRYTTLYEELCLLLRKDVDINCAINELSAYLAIQGMIKKCEWHNFYDVCQIAYRLLMANDAAQAREFGQSLSTLFSEENLGYRFEDGDIQKIRPEVVEVTIKEARYLLKEPEFKSADELFEKAIKALNIRPNPDVENCVKDAVAAIESVGKIIVDNEKVSLDDVMKDAVTKGIIPQPLDQTITKLHAYRGNEPAVAHGGIQPSKVTVDEAEFVLAMSAAIMVYLVRKRSQLS